MQNSLQGISFPWIFAVKELQNLVSINRIAAENLQSLGMQYTHTHFTDLMPSCSLIWSQPAYNFGPLWNSFYHTVMLKPHMSPIRCSWASYIATTQQHYHPCSAHQPNIGLLGFISGMSQALEHTDQHGSFDQLLFCHWGLITSDSSASTWLSSTAWHHQSSNGKQSSGSLSLTFCEITNDCKHIM